MREALTALRDEISVYSEQKITIGIWPVLAPGGEPTASISLKFTETRSGDLYIFVLSDAPSFQATDSKGHRQVYDSCVLQDAEVDSTAGVRLINGTWLHDVRFGASKLSTEFTKRDRYVLRKIALMKIRPSAKATSVAEFAAAAPHFTEIYKEKFPTQKKINFSLRASGISASEITETLKKIGKIHKRGKRR